MLKLKLFFCVLPGFILGNCSSTGFDRAGMTRQMQQEGPAVSDADIAKVMALKPQLKLPFRLAVYLESGYARYSRYSWYQNDFDLNEKKQFLATLMGNKEVVSEAFLIASGDLTTSGEKVLLKDIRLAAARYHADAVLVLKSNSNTDTYPNFLSLLYFTIVGFWIAPGSHCDAIHMFHGTLYDVRNEYLYIGAESDAMDSVVRPYALRECSVPLNAARKKAMESFSAEFTKRLATLK